MRVKLFVPVVLGFVLFCLAIPSTFAGDAFDGTVKAVRSVDLIVVESGKTQYEVRLVGIVGPKEGAVAEEGRRFVSNLVLGKEVRMRFEYRTKDGQMLSRVFTGDPGIDVGIEVLRTGLARKQARYDYKYGELSAAENEAKKARRGLWATQPR